MEKLNSEYELLIEDLTEEGVGIARYQGVVFFVHGATLLERARVKVIEEKKNFVLAEAVEVLESSPCKRDASKICKHFEECGGCAFGNLKYSSQLELKEKQVREKLIRIGKVKTPVVRKIIGMGVENEAAGRDGPAAYRNKAEFHCDGKKAGFYSQKSHEIVDIKECKIIPSKMLEMLNEVKGDVSSPCSIIVRLSQNTGEFMAFCRMPKGGSGVREKADAKQKEMVIAGKKTITDTLNVNGMDFVFEISPSAFYQVNNVQTEKLYAKALEYLDLKGDEQVLDLYCGVGTIGLVCAKDMNAKGGNGKVYGIEVNHDAVIDANRNAVINYIVNAEYICGKAENEAYRFVNDNENETNCTPGDAQSETEPENIKIDAVIVDPPRKGCDRRLLETLAKINPKKICYVSCNPSTLARDVKILGESGYEFVEATPVDMFPETGHVETVALITRVK